MYTTNANVDDYFSRITQWNTELGKLRHILLNCGLTEEYKYRQPGYSYKGKTIIILGGFKEFCVISFFKGVLLNDSEKLLVQAGENTRSARVVKFTDVSEINELETTLKAYIYETIEIEKAGVKVEIKPDNADEIPKELQDKFNGNSSFKVAFESLTPGRQRGYILHFIGAKQEKTRIGRIENCVERIKKGFGLNDCTCGNSKRMPACDGSHKYL